MNNWGQQPPGHGQAYNGHGYQQMPPQPGYQQQRQAQHQNQHQAQHQHQQQQQQHPQHPHQQQQYGVGNSMAYMGNQQYQAAAHFLPAPASNPQMQPMPQYAHVPVHAQVQQAHAHSAPLNNFHAQQHQHQHQRQQHQPHQQNQQPFGNGAYQHHPPVPQLQPHPQSQPQLQPHTQYISHQNYPPQVATPSPRPIHQRIPPQPAQPAHPLQPLQPQQPMSHSQLIPQKRRSVQQLQSPRLHSPHMPPGQLQPAQQLQSPRLSSPHVTPVQLQPAQAYRSPRVSSAHMPAAQPPPAHQLQSPRATSSHAPSNQLQPAPKLQSPRVNNQHVPATYSQPAPSVQKPPRIEPPAPPPVPPPQTQPALQSQQPPERKQPPPAPAVQTQRHVSDGIDPTQLMLKREIDPAQLMLKREIDPAQLMLKRELPAPAPARKSLPAPVTTRSPSISTRSPSMSHAQTPTSHFDTPAVLTCVADDCFQAAHSAVQDIAASLDKERVDEYYKLIATGLGCLDAALNLNKLPPRAEANIRLRYATALSEETDNLMEAETALTKGIAVCEKNRFTDLKYCMQFQLLKVLFRRNRKAAFVEIEKNIQDATTYKAVDWVYAFRFLKASLHLQSGNPADAQALENLRSITNIATHRGDLAIAVLTSLLEGIMHLKARKDDSIVRVQTCIAQASRFQLDPSVQIPQVEVLTLLLDLACTLQQKAPQVAMQKLKALQARMDELVQAHDWDKMLDELHLPLKRQPNSSASVTGDTKTIIQPGDGQHNFIVLSFVTKVHAFVLAYVLSGLALLYQGSKSEKVMEYWTEALNMLAKTPPQARPSAHSLPMAIEQARWQAEVKCYIYALIALISATRTQWSRVHDCIQKIEALNPKPEGGRLGLLVLYVTGIYHQGTGDIDRALQIFGDQRFAIPVAATINGNTGTPPPEVALLAAMNKIWIMQDPSRRDDEELTELIEKITPYCSDHADIDIRTAFNLMQAALRTEPRQSMQVVKKHIQAGLKWAQGANNTQLLAVALNLMRALLFENVVGDQAVKSAKAGKAQANKAGNLLWMSVGDGMLAQTEEMQGQMEEAERLRQDGTRYANQAFAKPEGN